ncbi:MAG: cyclic nucleotide-binding domain-containing protein [Candidatus Delongbacteria bacterium]|nr:cyclic nucleotide-binding domain-containing protein [Candidatus Delongbacteria bacterium]
MDNNSKNIFLRSISLCDNMNDEEIKAIAEHCRIKSYKKKNVIFLESDPGNMLYLISSGRVKITKLNEEGNEVILTILSDGDYFGEMSLLDDQDRNANAIAMDDVELLTITKNEFVNLLIHNSTLSLNLLKTFAIRLRVTDIRMKSFFLDDAQKKVIITLHNLAEKMGVSDGKDVIIQEVPNQTDLANMTGISRETLSRIINKFEMNKIIGRSGKDIKILQYNDFVQRFIDND